MRPGALGGLPGLSRALAAEGPPRVSFLGESEVLLAVLEVLGPRTLVETELLVLPPYRSLEVEELASATSHLVPALWSTGEGLAHFAEALEIARAYRLSAVAVLNPPAPCAPLGGEDRERAARTWRERGAPSVELRVHDLFLAEALGLAVLETYAGCQAGQMLAHVTEDGTVQACRTLPEPFGSLARAPLGELWSSPARRALRSRLQEPPAECGSCGVAERCVGACRGLSEALGRDPSCPSPRTAPGGP